MGMSQPYEVRRTRQNTEGDTDRVGQRASMSAFSVCPMVTIGPAVRVSAGTVAIAVLLGACGAQGDPDAVDVLERSVPAVADGVLYVSDTGDGSCATDCPPPTLSRGWIVDCDDAESARQSFVTELEAGGFVVDGDDHVATIDGVEIRATVSSYANAADGPTATEEPFVSDATLLDGACSLFVLAATTR